MASGSLSAVGIANSLIEPLGVIIPILFPFRSVNQRLPSGPGAIPSGRAFSVGIVNSAIEPLGVIIPIFSPRYSVNHRSPSGPGASPAGALSPVGIENWLIVPSGKAMAVPAHPSKAIAVDKPARQAIRCARTVNRLPSLRTPSCRHAQER
jgi:hypothetical protein